uniref:Zgc:162255 n=1 Tax=Takifugu rubripes TaxID=31033 RepID=A0A3B5KF33_TAKRU
MGTTTSEPCIYDKLSESIDILRQSGYRYGMSEREIERFIKQVLETNEPRREPPQFPILRAAVKFMLVVGFLLVMVLAFTYPQSTPQLGLVNLETYNWSSPLSHVRLLSLPIAKKYNLQGFHERWISRSGGQNLVNCSVCAEIYSVLEVPESLRATMTLRRGAQLLLLKGGGSLTVRRQQLEELYLAHSGSMSILMEADDQNVHRDSPEFPEGPANFTLLWYVPCRQGSWLHLQLTPSILSGGRNPSVVPDEQVRLEFAWMFQAVQPQDQREGFEVALSKSRAQPVAGQRWNHRAALPGHPQHKFSEQRCWSVWLAGGGGGSSSGPGSARPTVSEALQLLQPVAEFWRHGLR